MCASVCEWIGVQELDTSEVRVNEGMGLAWGPKIPCKMFLSVSAAVLLTFWGEGRACVLWACGRMGRRGSKAGLPIHTVNTIVTKRTVTKPTINIIDIPILVIILPLTY